MIKVNGETYEYVSGMTVKTIIEMKKFIFPLLIVQVNGVFVPCDQYENTSVPDEAIVSVIHLLSGG